MIGQNDGIENEKQIVDAVNLKQVGHLATYQKQFIKQLYKDNISEKDVVHARKIGGQGFKPDVEIDISGEKKLISVKKGSGNSVHQEKVELFVLFCQKDLGMSDLERDSLLAFLYGDGTLDGDSLPEERLSDIALLQTYSTEIQIVQQFLNRNKRSLLERFLIYGRKGKEKSIKADYLYHGDANTGVWCPLDYDAIDYLVSLPNSKASPLSIGPLTLQVWNRNLEGKPEMEARRHSIQIKWASCKSSITEINDRYLAKLKTEKTKRTRILGNNNQGFENQNKLISEMDGKRVTELTSNVKSIVTRIFPYVASTEIVHAGKVTGNDVKPRLYISVNGNIKYLTVFMGSGNSVHQEKISNFLEFCENELGITDEEKNAFLTIMYGDGTTDGNSASCDRLDNTESVKKAYGKQVAIAQAFFNRNKKELVERFLIYGKGGKKRGIGTDYIYYGTDAAGRIASRETVISYLTEKEGSDAALLSLGSLTTQPWNRNPEAKANLEDRRHSVQIKWGGIKSDLAAICDAEDTKNIGTSDGDWEEYELVGKLNRDKKLSNKTWMQLCSKLDLNNIDNIYAVRVSSMVYSKLSQRQVLPKADAYLVKGTIPHELLLDNNYWLDEESIHGYDVKAIPYSGISCKRPLSNSFTYAKLTPKSFESLFGTRALGAAISIFVKNSDLHLNPTVLEGWNVSENDFFTTFSNDLLNAGIDRQEWNVSNFNVCTVIKKAATAKTVQMIRTDKKISDALFYGKGVFEEPYTASFVYIGGQMTATYVPPFYVTTGSGRHNGKYTIIIKPRQTAIKNILDDDIYPYEEAKEIIKDTLFSSNDTVSELELLDIIVSQGYQKNGDLIIKNNSSGSDYFVELFEKEDILNLETYVNRFGLSSVQNAINSLEKSRTIIEYEKNQYINRRKIDTLYKDRDVLAEYCNEIYKKTIDLSFFTVKYLDSLNIESEALELGFEPLFYESLLKHDRRFHFALIGGTYVFSSKWERFKTYDVIKECIMRNSPYAMQSLLDDLVQEYGIVLDRNIIINQTKNTELYYDTYMEYLYRDENEYYDDL